MSLITHVFESHKRIQHGVVVSHDYVQRRANLEYDATGNRVIISILPTLSPKSAYLVKQVGFTLYYKGDDPANSPVVSWRAHSTLLFTNWLNYFVYQTTPYNIDEIE